MTAKTDLFATSRCLVAEGPRWNAAERALYWVDVTAGHVYVKAEGTEPDAFEMFDPKVGKIGALSFVGRRRLLLFANECKVWDYELGGTPKLLHALPDHGATRFNDVFTDGIRHYCGVAPRADDPTRRGELWMMDGKGTFTCVEPATQGMPNGMGLSPGRTTFYFVVTDERRVYAYDYDRADGTVRNRRVLCETEGEGLPDGMDVAPDGTLWIAFWNGGRLEHHAADGSLLGSVAFPMPKVTSVASLVDRMYVTTANLDSDPDVLFDRTGAGSVFTIRFEGE